MTQNSDFSTPVQAAANQTICSNCHSAMPSDLRFCRNCGFRLADSMGTYTATAESGSLPAKAKRRKMSGLSWLFIGLLVFFIGGAAFTALVSPVRQGVDRVTKTETVKSYIGIDEFKDTDQGVMLNSVSVPDGPADKAGLVGGDVIVSFDGQQAQNEDQMDELMAKTPVGKTVDVEYLRDGEKKTTKLTTVSLDEYRRMGKEFERRPEGRGVFGYEDGDTERVLVPGTKIYGVRLGTVMRSRPADMAGVKDDDIVDRV